MKQIIKKMKQISILLLVLSFVGCNNDDDNYPQVIAGFTYTINLETGTVVFINISENASSYEWSFGDENTSTEKNPINTYDKSGTYTVVLESKNVAGATDTFESEITFTIPEKLGLPINFDNADVIYNAAVFNGAAFEIVENPDVSGTNSVASNVGAITNSGAEYEGINFDLGIDIDLATEKTVSMSFWADEATTVLMKLEEGTGADTEVAVSHTGAGWETLLFSFNPSDKYSRLTLFVDGPGETAGTFYIDDVMQVETPPAPCTAETEESNSAVDLNMTFMSDPTASVVADGTSFEWAANPDFDNDLNMSCKVAKITKLGSNPWDNTQISLDAKLDFVANAGLKMKVYSAVPGFKVRVKLEENGAPENNTELEVATTKTDEWEEIEFPFASTESEKFDKIVIFFDLNAGNTDTYYFDDLMLYGTGSVGSACVAESTENNTAAGLNMTFMSDLTSSITNDNATFVWADNPDSDNSVNSSCKVAQITKSGTNPWDNNQIDLDAKLDLSANAGLKVKVYSAQPGYTVLLKLESIADPGVNTEIELTTTKTNEWEELSFAFTSNHDAKYDRIVLIFDLAEANTNTYYFDDLKLYERTSGGGSTGAYSLDKPIDFESTGFGANWSWNVFENEDNPPVEFVANPSASGINTSAQVAKITARQAGAPWVGAETVHGEMGITWDLSASNAVIKIMVYKTVISDVGIKLANAAGGAQGEIKVANTKINEWEELTFDFSSRIGNGLDGSTNIDQIIVFPEFTDGRSSDVVTYFDNITFNKFEVSTEQDATLSDLKVDGNSISGFNPDTLSYSVTLPEGTTTVPTVSVTETQGAASSVITPAGSLPGQTTIVVTAEDGVTTSTYTVDFTLQASGGNSGDYNLTLPIDFEPSGFGAGWTWNVFENVGNSPLEFVTNPSASGINTSSTVAKITALQAGAPWVGTEIAHGEMGITWTVSASNTTIKIMVYKTVISDVGIKLASANGGAQPEVKVANTKINEWEELTFDFSHLLGIIGQDGTTNVDQVIVFPDFIDGRASDNVVYFDNITFN